MDEKMEQKTKFAKLLGVIKKKKVFIQMHNYPDQDAVASAFGLAELLRYCGIESVICYQGEIDKVNTMTMRELLHMELFDVDDLEMEPEDEIIIVDGQKGNVNVQELIADEIACIDHHPMQNTDYYRFYDIRAVGACSSIIAEYFVENQIPVSKEAATALVYGIKMDTSNLVRQTTVLDVDMFCYMYKHADDTLIQRFENNSLQLSDLRAYRKALGNLKIYENRVGIANVGNDCSEAIMGTISDFIMSLGEVEFSVVFSYRAGGLKLSLRSETPKLVASDIVKGALAGLPGGGGGHPGMAAGFVPELTPKKAKEVEYLLTERIIDGVARAAAH